MAGGKGGQRPCAPGPRPCTPGLKDERRHLARSPIASSTRSLTRIQTGQPQGRTTATWPKAVREHGARGASQFAILSQSSADNRSANSWRNLPPRLTCMLRRPSSSQSESSIPAISQRFSGRMRSRALNQLFPIVTCFLHVTVSPALSTWHPQVAPYPIISPVEIAISASCHPPWPQGLPLLFLSLLLLA